MASYKVIYEIDVDADDAMDAALQVEETMKNPIFRPFLIISSQEARVACNIDLETGETK